MLANALLRHQFREFHQLLEETLAGVTPDQVQSVPPGTANPVGETYAHVVLWEDMGAHGLLQGRPPLSAGSWSGRTGLSELPPLDRPGSADVAAPAIHAIERLEQRDGTAPDREGSQPVTDGAQAGNAGRGRAG
jgi:hypothetical protein